MTDKFLLTAGAVVMSSFAFLMLRQTGGQKSEIQAAAVSAVSSDFDMRVDPETGELLKCPR